MQNIFAPWLLKVSIGNTEEIRKRMCEKITAHLDDSQFNSDFWNCNSWTSFKQRDFCKEEQNILNDMVNKPLQDIIKHFNYSAKEFKVKGWFNAYKEFQWQEFHNHLPAILSGVYFISFDEETHGKLSFKNPIPQWKCSLTTNSNLDLNPSNDLLYKEEFVPQVKESDLIIFPSGLEHGVKLSKKKPSKIRITYSFNVVCEE